MSKAITVLVILMTIFNVLALNLNWYHKDPWVDIPAHLSFGFLIGMLVLLFSPKLKAGIKNNKLATLGILLFIGLAVGSAWELIEFGRDSIYAIPRKIPTAQQGALDTLGDLTNNVIGLFVVVAAHRVLTAKGDLAEEAVPEN